MDQIDNFWKTLEEKFMAKIWLINAKKRKVIILKDRRFKEIIMNLKNFGVNMVVYCSSLMI